METYVESATALAGYDEEIERKFQFFWGGGGWAKMDFHHLAKPKNVSVDSKCDVLYLKLFVYGMPA